ncbi:glycosyltransferase [Polynucleobacter sp. MWH-UH25E]|uniref:glycosyltransferase n=1 Tax=Polynucleobacter sp. MWH-UH25E TaxID=1855616 RepID=UPI001BFD2E38|nr:glycosyltransferase [Polynucleobacter sp. MWH-UH25E]QWD62367.1 glycosyltransferase [Polynucleobacter sp. MWH-UH25E]
MTLSEGIRKDIQINTVNPTIFHRLFFEILQARKVLPGDFVLRFGNLPPLFKLKGRVVVFLQNRYLIDPVSLHKLPFKSRVRLLIERLWLSCRLKNVDEFLVQTPTMKKYLELKTFGKIPIRVLPFVDNAFGFPPDPHDCCAGLDCLYDFIYVASGEPHKNHQNLLEAWSLLGKEGIFPSLCLTIDVGNFTPLCSHIASLCDKENLIINNAGSLDHKEVLALYKKSKALIYPSKFESFGIPLIEAKQAGLPVLAPELDYVRDILDPVEVFDPNSSVSIARAVKRFIGLERASLTMLDAAQFLALMRSGDSL